MGRMSIEEVKEALERAKEEGISPDILLAMVEEIVREAPIRTRVQCDRCNHGWFTKSTHVYVTCPSCMRKVRVPRS